MVIPAYNEEPTVASVVSAIPEEIAGRRAEVIVVVDGATDATALKARGAGALVCDVRVNRGQGTVYWLGYWLARQRGAEVIATIDADGQYEESELSRVVEPIVGDRADVVYGSRRLGNEETSDLMRHVGLRVFGGLVSLLVSSADHRPSGRPTRLQSRGSREHHARAAAVPELRAAHL